METIKMNKPPERCPYCNALIIDGVCSAVGCALKDVYEAGFIEIETNEQFPIIEI